MREHRNVVLILVFAAAVAFMVAFVPSATATPEPERIYTGEGMDWSGSWAWLDDLVWFLTVAPLVAGLLGFVPAVFLGASLDEWSRRAALVLVVAVAVAATLGLEVGGLVADPEEALADPGGTLGLSLGLAFVAMVPVGLGALLGWWVGSGGRALSSRRSRG